MISEWSDGMPAGDIEREENTHPYREWNNVCTDNVRSHKAIHKGTYKRKGNVLADPEDDTKGLIRIERGKLEFMKQDIKIKKRIADHLENLLMLCSQSNQQVTAASDSTQSGLLV